MELTTTRLQILKALTGKKRNLSEIATETGIDAGTVYNSLKPLVEAGWVNKDIELKYSIATTELDHIRKLVEGVAPFIGGTF